MNARSSRPRRSRLGLVLLVAVIVVVGLEVLESVAPRGRRTPLRWLLGSSPPSDVAYRPLPYVNYGLVPDYAFARRAPDDPAKTTNGLGFRGPDVAVPKPEGTVRIVCLGGSTTFSDLVGDDETYPRLLERALREARPDRAIEVVNAGVPSYTSAESLANLAYRCLDLQPDVVVVYHAANDARPRGYETFETSYAHYRRVWDGDFDDYVPGQGEFGGINALIQRTEGYVDPADPAARRAAMERAGTEAFRRNLTSLCGVARAHGVRPVLVTFAADPDPSLPGADPVMIDAIAEHNRVIEQVGESQDVTVLDLDAGLSREGAFGDPVHLNAAGQREKARLLAEGLLAAGAL